MFSLSSFSTILYQLNLNVIVQIVYIVYIMHIF